MSASAEHGVVKAFSARRNINRKILVFSLFLSLTATVITALGYLGSFVPALRSAQRVHRHIFEQIVCTGLKCDTHVFTTDWKSGSPDYVLDTKTRFFIDIPQPTEESPGLFPPLDYSDPNFIARFRRPTWYEAPDGELWRLYSRKSEAHDQQLEILVGFAGRAPWKMIDARQPDLDLVDNTLKSQADQLASTSPSSKAPRGAGVDGYQIVDARTGKVFDWGPWLPIFFPGDAVLPRPGRQLFVQDGELYVVQTDTDGRLLATSLTSIGSLFWIAVVGIAVFIISFGTGWIFSRRFLRGYFALRALRVPTLKEALSSGEGQTIEFKRRLSDDPSRERTVEEEVLKSIAAFANTNDGAIFIGVDDTGKIVGLDLDFKQRDRLEQKIRQLARTRIKPTPPIQVDYEAVRDLEVAKIIVARGDDLAYLIAGVIYIRHGSADVQAQPEDLRRLIAEFAQ
jgi:hypothetical protein